MVSLNANDGMAGDLYRYGIDYEVPCEDSSDDAIVLPQNQFHLTDEEKAELFSDIDPLTCDQALFSFRSVKHSGGTGETKNRA